MVGSSHNCIGNYFFDFVCLRLYIMTKEYTTWFGLYLRWCITLILKCRLKYTVTQNLSNTFWDFSVRPWSHIARMTKASPVVSCLEVLKSQHFTLVSSFVKSVECRTLTRRWQLCCSVDIFLMASSEGWIRDSVSVTEEKSKLRGTEFT